VKEIEILKAGPIGPDEIESVKITIDRVFPDMVGSEVWDIENRHWNNAQALVDALIFSLPGGTLDRLTCLLMEKKCSLFRVPLFGLPAQAPEPTPTESEMCEMIASRDKREDRATRLAQAVGERFGTDVGKWSSANDPVCNAHEILDSPSLDNILGVNRKSVAVKLIALAGQMDAVAAAMCEASAADYEDLGLLSKSVELEGAAGLAREWAVGMDEVCK